MSYRGEIAEVSSYALCASATTSVFMHIANLYATVNLLLLPNFLSKAIGIINSAKHDPNFIVGTLN